MSPLYAPPAIAPVGQPISNRSGMYSYPGCNTSTSNVLGVGTLRAFPVYVPVRTTLDRIGAEVATLIGDVGSKIRLGIYADNGRIYPGALLLDAGTINGDSATVQELVLPTAVNMLSANQASIETDATGYAATNTTLTRSTAQSADGAASLSSVAVAAGPATAQATTSPGSALLVTAGQTYTAVGYFKAAVGTPTGRVQINWYDSAGVFISTTGTVSTTLSAFAWTAITSTAVAPTGAGRAAINVGQSAALAGDQIFIDKVGFFEGTQAAGAWAMPGGAANGGMLAPGVYWLAGVVQAVTVVQPTVRTALEIPFCPISDSNTVIASDVIGIRSQVGAVTGALPAAFDVSAPGSTLMPRIFVRAA